MTSAARARGQPCPIDGIPRGFDPGAAVAPADAASHVSERVDSCLVVRRWGRRRPRGTSLLEAGTRVTVVSPRLAPALLEVAREGRLASALLAPGSTKSTVGSPVSRPRRKIVTDSSTSEIAANPTRLAMYRLT